MNDKRYRITEIFYSIQGEGVRAGTPNVFLRFSRCNLRCTVEPGPKSPGGFDCDTEFESGEWMTGFEIVNAIERARDAEDNTEKWVICTGGEPALQLDVEICKTLHNAGWKIAVETNGSMLLPTDGDVDPEMAQSVPVALSAFTVDWITVSPKVAEHAIRQKWAHEVKYVRGAGQGIPETKVNALHHLLSPAFNGMDVDIPALQHCMTLCKRYPTWRLSTQMHKSWNVR